MRPLLMLALSVGPAFSLYAQETGHRWLPCLRSTADSTWQTPANTYENAIAVAGPSIYVAWIDDRTGRGRVVLARSPDQGASWMSERSFGQVAPNTWDSALQLVAGNDHVHLFWSEGKTWSSPNVRHHVWSHDRGATWTESTSPAVSTGCDLAVCEGDDLVVMQGTTLRASQDGGVSWSPPRPIGAAFGVHLPQLEGPPAVLLSHGVLHVAWTETGTWPAPSGAFYNCSPDLGRTWLASDRRLQAAPGNNSRNCRLVADGPRAFVAWDEPVATGVRLFGDRTLDGGKSWFTGPVPLGSMFPTLSDASVGFDGSSLCLIGNQGSGSSSSPVQVVCSRSADLGATWSPIGPPVLTLSYFYRFRFRSGLSMQAGAMVFTFVYQDRLSFPSTNVTQLLASVDGGVSWQVMLRFTNYLLAGGAISMTLASDRDAVSALFSPSLPFGHGLAWAWIAGSHRLGGAAGRAAVAPPELSLDHLPLPGGVAPLRLRDPGGGAVALLAFGWPRAPLPFLAGQLLLDPGPCLCVSLANGPGNATEASVPLRFPWPLPGWVLACQAFVPDAQAPYGVAMSGALQVLAM